MVVKQQPATNRQAVYFVILLGLVSLCADITYEGARAIIGPYLGLLGASAVVIGAVAGAGELLGYVLRLWSGVLADRTGRYWALTIVGYTLNLLAVPALAITSHWVPAACLVLLERIGKALRTPARDAMLSFATSRTGHGWGFGLHEALDQIGATAGPLLVATIVAAHSEYRGAFAWLLLPATAALALLFLARLLFPQPRDLHVSQEVVGAHGLPKVFWIYLAGACCVAAGYADYALVAYHFQQSGHISTAWIAVLYATAMIVDGLAALLFGRWFDRAGVRVLLLATILSAFAPMFLFGRSFAGAVGGVVLWGIGLGAQESVLRAAVARLTPVARRASAYGVFNMAFGFAWFGGSTVLGFLYSFSIPTLMLFAAGMQVAALPLFWEAGRAARTIQDH